MRDLATNYKQTHTHSPICTYKQKCLLYIYTYLLRFFVSAKAAASVDSFYLSSQLLTFSISWWFFCYFLQAASLRFPLRGPRHLLFCATHASFHFPIQASNVRASHTHIDIHIHTCDGAFSFALLCVHIRSLFSGSYSATDAVTATNVRIVVDTDSVMAHDICSVSTKCANISTNATSIYYTNICTCVCAILLFHVCLAVSKSYWKAIDCRFLFVWRKFLCARCFVYWTLLSVALSRHNVIAQGRQKILIYAFNL